MTEFNLYRVYYYSAPQYKWDVRIDLYMSAAAVGTLLFMKTGQPIPANTIVGGIPRLHYSITDFAAMMSMIREEKPLFINLNEANGIGTICTSDEPVGEQEGV
ncbi:MAG: hypothetical protein ABI925_11415 [Verrucomicrobiota bacterium]